MNVLINQNVYETYRLNKKYIKTAEQIKEFYNNCPKGYEVEEWRILNPYLFKYETVALYYVPL